MTPSPEIETVKDAATSARILSLLKENRIELIGCIILAHLLGVSDRVLGQKTHVVKRSDNGEFRAKRVNSAQYR